MKLKDINKKEFEDFCKEQECDNFFQSKYYAEIKRLEGYYTYFVGLDDNGRLLGATLLLAKEVVLLKKREFYAPRGIIIDYDNIDLVKEFTNQLVDYTKLKKGAFIKIKPIINNNIKLVEALKKIGWHQGNKELLYPREENLIYRLNLDNITIEDLANNLSDKIKKELSENEKMGISTKK